MPQPDGDHVRKKRLQLGLTGKQVARLLSVARGTIRRSLSLKRFVRQILRQPRGESACSPCQRKWPHVKHLGTDSSPHEDFAARSSIRFSRPLSIASIINPVPVPEGLCDMRTQDVRSASEVRNRARDFKCSMVAARREVELRCRSLQHSCAVFINHAMPLDVARKQ